MTSGWTIRSQLFLLIGAVAMPLLALLAYDEYRDFSSERDTVSATGRSLVEVTAAETSRFLHDTQVSLASLSQRPLVRALDPQRCDPALGNYLDAHPNFANVVTINLSAQVVCSKAPVSPGSSKLRGDIVLDKVIRTEAFTVSKATRGPITGKWVVVLGYPLRDEQGRLGGAIGLAVDLVNFQPRAGGTTLPSGTSIHILSRDGTIIASLQNPQAEIGRDARGSEIADIVLARERGEARALGADGIERIYAFLPIPGVDWYAYAGVPVSVAFAELNQRTLQSAVIGSLIVLLALAFALAAARGVTRPVHAIGETAMKLQAGDRDARFRLEGPVEIAQVLAQFNRTLDALAEDERRRRESEGRYSEIIESIAEGIIGIDEQQCIVVFNAAAEQMFGRPAAQVIGEPINTLIPERLRAQHAEHIDRFAATGRTSLAMGRYGLIYGLRASGEEFPVEATVSQSGASPDRLLTVILRDVTERRRVEEAQALLAAVVQNSNDAIIGRSVDGRILSWNPAAERLFGYTAAEIIGQSISRIIPPDREDEVAHDRALLAQGHGQLDCETVRLAKDGRRIDVSLSQSPIRNERGAAVGASLIYRDISKRKRAEQAQAFLAAIVENSNDAIIASSLDTIIQSWNPAAERVFGYTAAEAIGQRISLIIPPDREDEAARNRALLAQGDVLHDHETVRLGKGGKLISVSYNLSLIRDADDNIVGTAGIMRDISERKQAQERIDYLAQYDQVTGLPNRRLFNDRLTLAMARDKRLGVMTGLLLLDLDRFKTINETLGHSTGDKLLQAVTARLRDRLREVDTVARLGGDEFAVILESVTEKPQASRVAEKILEAMAEPFTLEGEELFITASIGVAVHPADADSVEKLIENAELAMYRAKADGRNAVQLYVSDKNPRRVAGLSMESKLRRAIERDELLLNFQPKVDMRTGAITGAEALLRWRNPDLGPVSPADFIPLAEETGLILPIGEWVLHSACAQASAWHRLGYPITVAVNLSARQFRHHDLCGMIALMLADTGLPAGALELEITESMIMHRPEQTIATLRALHDMGVTLSVDDFGTGYSSLAYLKRFPVHTLKVDQSFVRDLHQSDDNAAIVRAIIALAQSLGLKTVAEGVETEQQRSFLAGLHCDEYQGYYFSKPLPAAEFMRLLQERGVAAVAAVECSS